MRFDRRRQATRRSPDVSRRRLTPLSSISPSRKHQPRSSAPTRIFPSRAKSKRPPSSLLSLARREEGSLALFWTTSRRRLGRRRGWTRTNGQKCCSRWPSCAVRRSVSILLSYAFSGAVLCQIISFPSRISDPTRDKIPEIQTRLQLPTYALVCRSLCAPFLLHARHRSA